MGPTHGRFGPMKLDFRPFSSVWTDRVYVASGLFFRGNLVELSSTTSDLDPWGGFSSQSLVNTEVRVLCLQVTALHSVCNIPELCM